MNWEEFKTKKEKELGISSKPSFVSKSQNTLKPSTVMVERWSIYKFTLPVTTSKRVALGFETKDAAKTFIIKHLSKKKSIIETEEGNKIITDFDVIMDERQEINVYENDSLRTTVGNDPIQVLRRWMED